MQFKLLHEFIYIRSKTGQSVLLVQKPDPDLILWNTFKYAGWNSPVKSIGFLPRHCIISTNSLDFNHHCGRAVSRL
jgi:hypothetical protein